MNLDALKPPEEHRWIDLVSAAGVDVSDWANYKRGKKWEAANPRYCYNWAFLQPGKIAVLNLWHSNMRAARGTIVVDTNMRAWAEKLRNQPGPRVANWRRRALEWDDVVKTAVKESLPVRAIVSDGRMRRSTDLSGTSHVDRRLLDPVPWAVTHYDPSTGDCTLARGAMPMRLVDQFSVEGDATGVAERRSVSGEAFVRNAAVRRNVLRRANGACEWCSAPGFSMPDGSVYLETHHIESLGEGGPDTEANVAAVCANHHREAHFGSSRALMRAELLKRIASKIRAQGVRPRVRR